MPTTMHIGQMSPGQTALEVINPLAYPGWDELLLTRPDSTIFHTTYWARVLHESYGYEAKYFSCIDRKNLIVALPFMEIKSLITGFRGVSLPFTDYCDPILGEACAWDDVFSTVAEYGEKKGWRSIELRGSGSQKSAWPPSEFYYGHRLNLETGETMLYAQFRRATRRNIKKAVREGVSVAIARNPEAIREFYRLNCLTRKRHGLPPQPLRFFQNIYEHIIAKGHGFITLAGYKGSVIAGALFLQFGNTLLYKYGASDKQYQHTRSNDLVIWESIKHACRKGFKTLCLGRTEPENKGLRSFKQGWGTHERIIEYGKYDIPGKHFITGRLSNAKFRTSVFKRMPIPISKCIGAILYRHAG